MLTMFLSNRDEMRKSYKMLLYLASSFRAEDFLEIDQPETRIDYGAMLINGSGQNKQSL
jgi:hypothetical protein